MLWLSGAGHMACAGPAAWRGGCSAFPAILTAVSPARCSLARLVDAFLEYDEFFALSRRQYVHPNFAELRHIFNIAQVCWPGVRLLVRQRERCSVSLLIACCTGCCGAAAAHSMPDPPVPPSRHPPHAGSLVSAVAQAHHL